MLSSYSVVIFRLLYAQNVPSIRNAMLTTNTMIANVRDCPLAAQLAIDSIGRSKLSVASLSTRVHSSGAMSVHKSNSIEFAPT